ncbi:hypothetical protein EGH21_23910 [Halomicroarcula sp. F13]|uniref:Uncharacterized protein n=1 Tax=Haloarcula rubra TaxID=2487747 RepID=A0AAW4PZP3_9EURY|nr:hypothetical protein [Halomicroarcula rubra]MBX0326060.1 hypothetical protein [Halomicroarcula rubra]
MTTDLISNSDGYDEPTNSPNRVTTDQARGRLKDTLFSALESGENTLIDAPTSLGKSHRVATTRWRDYPEITGGKQVIHIHQTKKARKDAVKKSRNEPGVDCRVLRGRSDSCPVAAGDYDEEFTAPLGLAPSKWFDWMCNVRNNTFLKAHKKLDQHLDLPCGEYCDGVTQWWNIEYDEDEPEYDVLHTTANFAHVDELIEGANVIFDERPEYGFAFDTTEREQFQDATTNLLCHRSDETRAMVDLKYAVIRDKPELQAELREYFEDEVTEEWLFRREETHRLAPAIGRAILDSEEICAGRYHGKDGRVEVVMAGQDGEIRHVQHTPDLSKARCVIGLDAFPSETRWRINTVDDLEPVEVLSPAERKWWRRNERGLVVKQIGDATRSYTRDWKGAGESRAKAIIQKVRGLHGEAFQSCISPGSIEPDVQQMMAEAGIEEPKMMHYGEQKSRNDFEEECTGLLIGCIDPGDENILDLLVLCDMVAERVVMRTKAGNEKRKPGRVFSGPDANVAAELLASVRENNLAQAVGRYARSPDDANSGATVYVWSDAIPRMLVDEKIETGYRSTTEKREQFVEVLNKNLSGCTARTISEETGSDKSYVINWLDEMEQQDRVTKSKGTGYQGADEWRWSGGDFEMFVMFDS